jgi:hypothetical protein
MGMVGKPDSEHPKQYFGELFIPFSDRLTAGASGKGSGWLVPHGLLW